MRPRIILLAKLWVEQLSIRRCIWCWNKQTVQSHALWKIYGQRGVALVSTVRDVKQAVTKAGSLRAIVSPVSYSIPPAFFFDDVVRTSFEMTQFEMAQFKMLREENLPFPYLFKHGGYKYEEEVRFGRAALWVTQPKASRGSSEQSEIFRQRVLRWSHFC